MECTTAHSSPPETRAAGERTIRGIEADGLVNARTKDPDKLVSACYADEARYLDAKRQLEAARTRSWQHTRGTPPTLRMIGDDSVVKMDGGAAGLAFVEGASTKVYVDRKTRRSRRADILLFSKSRAMGRGELEDMGNDEAPRDRPVSRTMSGSRRVFAHVPSPQ
jgi:hypothetical protein